MFKAIQTGLNSWFNDMRHFKRVSMDKMDMSTDHSVKPRLLIAYLAEQWSGSWSIL